MIVKNEIPKIGGIALLFLIFLIISFFGLTSSYKELLLFSLIVTIFGLIDDYINLAPDRKIIGQVIILMIFISVHYSYVLIPFYIMSFILMMNSSNLIDGIDGLLGSLSLITFVLLLINVQSHFMLILSIMICIAIVLIFNAPNASMYFGESGSILIGFLLNYLIIDFGMTKFKADENILLVNCKLFLICLSFYPIPILDSIYSVLRRLKSRRNIFSKDQDHIHHIILKKTNSLYFTICLIGILHIGVIIFLQIVIN